MSGIKTITASLVFLTEGVEMKKLLACTAIVGGVAGTLAYINKNGLPIPGNLTMHIPVKLPIDFWDIFTKGIEIAEGFTK